MSKRNILSILFLVLLFGFIFIIALVFSNKKIDNYSNLEIVSDYNIYFSVVDNTNNFINIVSNKDKMKTYSLLDSNFIKKKRVNKNNVLDKVGIIDDGLSFVGDKIYYIDNDNKYIYLVTGSLINDEQKIIVDDYKIGLVVDYNSLLVSFFPLKDEKDIDYIVDINIKSNGYNSLLASKSINQNNMCKLYYGYFIDFVNNDRDKLYDVLSDEIKNQYSLDDFKRILNSKYNNYIYNFKNCKIDINDSNSSRLFTITDNKNNKIKIYENGVMNYKVNLDLN